MPIISPSPFRLPQPLAATSPLFASTDLPALHISYKWNHTIWNILGLLCDPQVLLPMANRPTLVYQGWQ